MIWELGACNLDFGQRVQVMGILNTTPDSFYDGGHYHELNAALERALEMEQEGADIIDIGGESSRPSMYGAAAEVAVEEECDRVVPVIEGVRRFSQVPISVDTTKAEVARRALRAGADIVNDISAMQQDEAMVEVVAASGTPIVLMHRRGAPATMQKDTDYDDLLGDIKQFLQGRIACARGAGVAPERIAVDPGLGFGKSIRGNLQIVRHLDQFIGLGYPVLLGASRKSFIWKTLNGTPEDGLEGSLTVAVLGAQAGVHMLRVHDVRQTVGAVRMVEAIVKS
jgi:dihydropteroate synthase